MSNNGNNIPAAPQQLSNNNAEKTRWYTEAGKYLNNIQKLRNNVAKGSVSINNAMAKATNMSSRVDKDVEVYRKQLLNSVQSELRSMNIVPNNKVTEYSNLIRRIQRAKIAHLYRKGGKFRAKHAMTSWDTLNKKILDLLKDNKDNIRAGMAAAAKLFEAGFFVRARELMSKVTNDADKVLKNKLNKLKARVADPNANAKPAKLSRSPAMVPNRNANANLNKELEELEKENNAAVKRREKAALNRNKASNNNANGQGIQNIFNGKFNNNMSPAVNTAVAAAVNPLAEEESSSNNMLVNAATGAMTAANAAETLGANNEEIKAAAEVGAAAGANAKTIPEAAEAGMSAVTSNPAFNSSATGEGNVIPSTNNNQGNEQGGK